MIAESIYHAGSPWSIQLALESDTDVYTLLDHIPQDSTSKSPSASNPHIITVNVDIPNINCPNCALILYNPMISGSDWCTRGWTNCSAYHSCANVQIEGTLAPAAWATSYTYTAPEGPFAGTLGIYQSHSSEYNGTFPMNAYADYLGTCADFQPSNSGGPSDAPTPDGASGSLSYAITWIFVLHLTLLFFWKN